MMNPQRRPRERRGKSSGEACTDQQRARQPRTSRVGNEVDGRSIHTDRSEQFVQERDDSSNVIARSELGDNATVCSMHVRLAVQGVPEQPWNGESTFAVDETDAGFVT